MGALDGRLSLEERETDKQSRCNVQRNLGDEVYRVTPVGRSVALEQKAELVEPRRRELALQTRLYWRLAPAFRVDALELLLNVLGFGRLLPSCVPVDISGSGGAGTDGLEDILSPVSDLSVNWAFRSENLGTYGFSTSLHFLAPFRSK